MTRLPRSCWCRSPSWRTRRRWRTPSTSSRWCGASRAAGPSLSLAGPTSRRSGLAQGCASSSTRWWRIEIGRGPRAPRAVWMSLAVVGTGLVYFFAVFSVDDVAAARCRRWRGGVRARRPRDVRRRRPLPDLVDVRGLVVRWSSTVARWSPAWRSSCCVVALLDGGRGTTPTSARWPACAALSRALYHPCRWCCAASWTSCCSGSGRDPLGAASEVAGRIGDGPGPRAAGDPRGAGHPVRRRAGRRRAAGRASGTETTHTRTLDLDGAGELVVGLRPGDLSFSQRRRAGAAADRRRCWPRRCGPGPSRPTSWSPGARPSPRWRRSGAGCAATCTTGSGRGCPVSRSPPTRPAT